MTVTYFLPGSSIQIQAEAATQKEAFSKIAALQELYADEACGVCGHAGIHCCVRESKAPDGETYTYFEFRCSKLDCFGRLDVGQSKDNETLYVKRKDDDGNVKGTNGWYVYEKAENGDTQHSATQQEKSPKDESLKDWIARITGDRDRLISFNKACKEAGKDPKVVAEQSRIDGVKNYKALMDAASKKNEEPEDYDPFAEE